MKVSPERLESIVAFLGFLAMAFFELSIAVPFEWFWRLLGWS